MYQIHLHELRPRSLTLDKHLVYPSHYRFLRTCLVVWSSVLITLMLWSRSAKCNENNGRQCEMWGHNNVSWLVLLHLHLRASRLKSAFIGFSFCGLNPLVSLVAFLMILWWRRYHPTFEISAFDIAWHFTTPGEFASTFLCITAPRYNQANFSSIGRGHLIITTQIDMKYKLINP